VSCHWYELLDNDNQSHKKGKGSTGFQVNMSLNHLPRGKKAQIVAIDWNGLATHEARRLRELGFDEGVSVELLHHGPVGRDPIACRVGRMTVALRRAHAAAISVVPDEL
jgi:ferrous iron transport protein A